MTERTNEHRLLTQYLAEIRHKPLLPPAQELALGEQKNAGAKARQQVTSGSFVTREEGLALAEHMRAGDQAHTALVEGNVRYVVTIAKKYASAGRAQGFSLLDVIQDGNVGLTRAIEKFDVRRGFRVTTYVTWWIRQAITRALAEHSGIIHIPERLQRHVRRLAVLQDKPTSATGQAPSVADIAQAMGMQEKKAKQVRDVSHFTFLSFQAPGRCDASHRPAPGNAAFPEQERRASRIRTRATSFNHAGRPDLRAAIASIITARAATLPPMRATIIAVTLYRKGAVEITKRLEEKDHRIADLENQLAVNSEPQILPAPSSAEPVPAPPWTPPRQLDLIAAEDMSTYRNTSPRRRPVPTKRRP